MKILLALDKFKGSLNAAEACFAVERGISKNYPQACFDHFPISDGGEGFAQQLHQNLKGQWVKVECLGMRGEKVRVGYSLIKQENRLVAVIEMALINGFLLLKESQRNPMNLSTYGTGQIIAHAAEVSRVDEIVIGIGGSATNDAGLGMAQALGSEFLDAQNKIINPIPKNFPQITNVSLNKMIKLPPVTVACDVSNPLLGSNGATFVFGGQKGLTEAQKLKIEADLARLVNCLSATKAAEMLGAGAAGGLGFGLFVFCQAKMVSGFDWFSQQLNLEQRLIDSDMVITGEGCLDAQTLNGKGPMGIAKLAKLHKKPVMAFAGKVDEEILKSQYFDQIYQLTSFNLPLPTLMEKAEELLEQLASTCLLADNKLE